MPLVRVEVRNEYGLGMPELYTETNREDPKAVLDGVAVAGLVGILRQLGDLAEFAAEVFHGLQEQVLITSSRSHKLVERVHNIEAALPPLEKAILAQRSHLHFAYTAGSHWHTRLRTEQNHFIYSDLPRCIMDSYEDCRDPPRLHKLDKFDIGGPGSCFRRYSDPTYFKRTSAGPYEAHLQSVPREKKARRSKKKRSSLRYRDVTHGAPKIMHAGRTDYGSSNFEGKTSPSQDVSTFHVPQKSGIGPEIGDHLTAFDSRNGSEYIECIIRPSYSTQSEDNNAKELSSDSNLQHNSYLDSASLDENSGVPDENIHDSYLAEHSRSRSSYITWDEKLEILDSTGQPNDVTEISCTTEKIDTEEKEDVDQIDFGFQDEPLPTSVIVGSQPDEIESETDYYMDALNTIESESEADIEFQTKRELQQYSSLNNKDVEEMHKAGHLDDSSTNFEFQVPENQSCLSPKAVSPEYHVDACSSSKNENYEDLTKSSSSPVDAISSICFTTPEKVELEEVKRNDANLETVASDGLYSSSIEPNSQQIVSTYESPKPSSSTSNATLGNPVMFWTNGGLLGLEPSKPPDFGLPTAVGPGPMEENRTESQKNTCNAVGDVAREDMVVNGPKSESSGKLSGSNGFNFTQEHHCNDGPVPKDDPTKDSKEDITNSSRIFEFSNRLLVNGFRRQITLVGNERLASSVRSDVPESKSMQKGYQTVTGIPFREQFGSGPPLISPSSPPLEHMRISFQPIDGFETSKLKLMVPDGNNNNETSGHMFPSFQLVPEPAISLHESASDSDDDTFCRSSPYASDDCNSHPSESNSEQWDSTDSPRIKDHELDDAFGRISSAESVSSSLMNGIRFQQGFHDHGNYGHQSSFSEDGMHPSQHGLLHDFPNFDSMNTSHNKITGDFDGKSVLQSSLPKEPTSLPPPLPPMEWRGTKLNPDVTMEKEDDLSEALTYALNLTTPEPTVSQQPVPAPIKQDHFVESVDLTLKHEQPEWQNRHAQNESNRTTNWKAGDEKEDFLQQIRTKSLNLRRTSTARPTTTPAGPTSVKVTAILEKASAIRQVVGSDDGDDDNWSDT
ncbi:protein SCAR3-like isoform X1 [Cynara cardunculus var. scolymus]|uniref:protein SCAR3-like isoform X1 n=1 Tax=Cynara cardunculus var. scolymus TaxID=59895 RepID=UPI000D622F0E|nr:protein SCAR3-like isoform X1 [Cynara cardunculus var. scolymus]